MDDSTEFLKYFQDPKVLEGIEGVFQPASIDNAPAETAPAKQDHGLPPILKGSEFPAPWELEVRPYQISGMLQRGDLGLIVGKAKQGKSLFLGNAAICIATGTPFLGRKTQQSNVMYIDLELRRDVACERLYGIAKAKGFDSVPDSVFLWSLARHTYNLETIVEVLESKLDEMPKIDLVIVDPIYLIASTSGNQDGGGFDENNVNSVTGLLTALEKLTSKHGSSLLICHHQRKGSTAGADSMERASGSGAFSRWPDSIITLQHHEEEDCSIVEMTTRNFRPPNPICYELDAPIIKLREDLDYTKYRPYGAAGKSRESRLRRILDVLPLHRISKQEWYARCRTLSVSEANFIEAVEEFVANGCVDESDQGFQRNREVKL